MFSISRNFAIFQALCEEFEQECSASLAQSIQRHLLESDQAKAAGNFEFDFRNSSLEFQISIFFQEIKIGGKLTKLQCQHWDLFKKSLKDRSKQEKQTLTFPVSDKNFNFTKKNCKFRNRIQRISASKIAILKFRDFRVTPRFDSYMTNNSWNQLSV